MAHSYDNLQASYKPSFLPYLTGEPEAYKSSAWQFVHRAKFFNREYNFFTGSFSL